MMKRWSRFVVVSVAIAASGACDSATDIEEHRGAHVVVELVDTAGDPVFYSSVQVFRADALAPDCSVSGVPHAWPVPDTDAFNGRWAYTFRFGGSGTAEVQCMTVVGHPGRWGLATDSVSRIPVALRLEPAPPDTVEVRLVLPPA